MEILKGTRPFPRRLGMAPAVATGLFAACMAAAHPAARTTTTASALVAAGPVIPSGSLMTVATSASERFTRVASAGQRATESGCWRDSSGESFRGSQSMTDVGGRTVIYEQIGTRGTTAIIQKRFDDLHLCFVAEDVGDRGRTPLPSRWAEIAPRFLLEARRDGMVQQLEGTREGSARRLVWRVGGRERPFDSAAEQWRDRMLAVLDTTWELSALYGQVSSLRGEISSILGERSSLQGEISSLRGHVSSLRGRISSIRGHESSLRGEISSIQGHLSSLRGSISSERGAISSLNAARYQASDAGRTNIAAIVARHEAEIARLEQEIRAYDADARVAAVEREIKAFDGDGKIASVEAEIRAFDVDKKVADVERRIAALDVENKVAAIERQIAALDADRRGAQLRNRRDDEIKRLRAVIDAIR